MIHYLISTKKGCRCLYYAFFLALFALVSSCSNGSQQAGTATEGESYISGYVYYNVSTSTASILLPSNPPLALMKGGGFQGGFDSAYVALVTSEFGQTGFRNRFIDSVLVSEDGYFEMPLPQDGVYSLIARAKGAVGVHTPIVANGTSIEMDSIGMSRTVDISGTVSGLPDSCAASLTALSGETAALSGSDSTFVLEGVSGGFSALFLSCGSMLQQWNFVIPGYCDSVQVLNLPYDGSMAQNDAIQDAIPSLDPGFSLNVLEPIVLRQSCLQDFNSSQ